MTESNSTDSGSPSQFGAPRDDAKAIESAESPADMTAAVRGASMTLDQAASSIARIAAEFQAQVEAGKAKISALEAELSQGGLVARVHEVEMALASLAAPQMSQGGHDGTGILQKWFSGVREVFAKRVAQHADESKKSVVAAKSAALAAGTEGA